MEHHPPTPATIKELYANAYCCAFPDCPRPLYKVDSESGVRTLNSRAAHICARSHLGPRWDENQSEDENRSVKNLLALCLEHADEIDNPKNIARYPTALLLSWKQKQLADFDALGKGWSVTDEDAEKLAHFTIKSSIVDSTVDLGGKGGDAFSAGGGGGGVFGSPNSKGGEGGKGGDIFILGGSPGTAPGAGGGGAGSLGKDASAGSGGSGGEHVQFGLKAEDFSHIEIEIGEGGREGKNGGDTIIKVIGKSGAILKTIFAKGGVAGSPGEIGDLSEFARPLTKDELNAGAGITSVLLTEVFHFKDGLANLICAGWDAYKVPRIPYPAIWPLYVAFSVVGLPVVTVIECRIQIVDPTGQVVYEKNLMSLKLDSRQIRIPHGVILSFEVTKYGIWKVQIVSGELIIAVLPIEVSQN